MKTGINLLLWTPFVTEEHFGILETLKKVGFDGVEVPLFGGDAEHYKKVGAALKDKGLECTSCTVMPDEERNPISADPKHRQGSVDYLKWAVDCNEAMGSKTLCGPIYQPLGGRFFTGQGPTDQEKQRAVEVHREVADYAQQAGVTLCLECLNRFEAYFLNTMADAAAHAKRVNHPNFALMYDSFHGNIEENDPVGAVAKYAGMLCHFHVSSNNRGTPGKGHIPFGQMFKALKKAGYNKWLTIEAFGRSLPELAATTCVWRDLSASNEECYTEGFKMIQKEWAAA